VIPDGRTQDFVIWRACERLGVRPPGVRENWESMGVWSQAKVLAYDQVRGHDEAQLRIALARARAF